MHSIFPDPRTAPADSPMAIGEDFRTETLLAAYRQGIFPWPEGNGAVLWWSPDPRAVFPIGGVRRSRSMRRLVRSGTYEVTVDRDFPAVVEACATRPGEGTWITPAMQAAYARLHAQGHAHSVEVWRGDTLVGGLYGVAVGRVFTGESMFHRESNTSKLALIALDDHLAERGFILIDAQLHTPHLESMGAVMVPRADFLDLLGATRDDTVPFA